MRNSDVQESEKNIEKKKTMVRKTRRESLREGKLERGKTKGRKARVIDRVRYIEAIERKKTIEGVKTREKERLI